MTVRGTRPVLDRDQVRSILVIRLMSLGDVILSLPVLTALRGAFPRAALTLLVDEAFADAARGHASGVRVWAIPRAAIRKMPFFRRMIAEWGWMSRVRQERFDLLLDLQGTPRAMWTALFSRIPVRAGFSHRGRGFVHTVRVAPDNRYAVEVNLDLVRALGIEPADKRLSVAIGSEDRDHAERFLREQGVAAGERVIAFHTGGGWPAKCWPREQFARLAWMIADRGLGRVALLQGPAEAGLVPELAAMFPVPPLIAAGFTVKQTGALLQRCAALVSNDTGPMHLALALRVPVIGLFGQENKDLWFPAPQHLREYAEDGRALALQHRVWCCPCHRDECDRMDCLRAVTPGEVFQNLEKMIQS